MVQKGKFSADAVLWVNTLKKVDFLRKETHNQPQRPASLTFIGSHRRWATDHISDPSRDSVKFK